MSVAVGVDVGASRVKVATAESDAARAAYTGMREFEFPDLISRVGTRVAHVGRDGDQVVTRYAEDLFVQEARVAVGQLGGSVRGDGAGLTIITPDWWTHRAHAALRESLREWGLERTTLVSSAVAAVRGYRATASSMPTTVVVLDLGAHTCSASVVTDCGGDGIRRVGHPTALHGRGGDDLDARLLHHVLDGLRGQGLTYDPDDPDAVEAARQLLEQCRDAKEALSVRPVITLTPGLAGAPSQFRLVRAEHDDVARPAVREVVQLLKECLSAAEIEVDAVLLVGGGAPIPVVAQQISVELGLPVLLDGDPTSLAARGAALQALATIPAKRGSRRPIRLSGWWSRSKTRRAAAPVNDRRHRGARAGVAAAYVALALAAIGNPVSSDAGTPEPDRTPAASTGQGGAPSSLLPGINPRPHESPTVPEEDADVLVETPVTSTSTLPVEPAATKAPKTPKKPAGTSTTAPSGGHGGGSGSGGSPDPDPPTEPPDTTGGEDPPGEPTGNGE